MRFALTLLVAGSVASTALAEVKVTPTNITETRSKELVKPDKMGMSFSTSEGLSVTLKLAGPEVTGATEYKIASIAEAKDDTGASLIEAKPKFTFGGDGFQKVSRMTFNAGADKEPTPTDLDVKVEVKTPSRKATKLVSLKGSMQVRGGGEKKVVVVKDIKSLAGKAIDNADLTAAKLKAKAGGGKEDADPSTLNLELSGEMSALQSIDVIDAKGELVSYGYSAFDDGKTTTHSISLKKPLDATMAVRFNLLVGQKVIDVPFELKDLPLP